jgi:hypothetical protein
MGGVGVNPLTDIKQLRSLFLNAAKSESTRILAVVGSRSLLVVVV